MKITLIKRHVSNPDNYAVHLDGKYSFSLNSDSLLKSKIYQGMELTGEVKRDLEAQACEDKIYHQVLKYLSLRPRSEWEIETYLKRKQTSLPLTLSILSKLTKLKYVDDYKFTKAFVNNAVLLHPASRRKLKLQLRQKHVPDVIIDRVMGELEGNSESTALAEIITKKRRISRYQDDTKLMQYLSRQGFNYGDIKEALKNT